MKRLAPTLWLIAALATAAGPAPAADNPPTSFPPLDKGGTDLPSTSPPLDKGGMKGGVARAKYLWSKSPYGRMLERILPPSIEPAQLPEPESEGARLTARYCLQCHYLPNPQMHTADKWNTIVVRMVWRMQGQGNLGVLMKEMMDQVEAPAEPEVVALTRYLQKHGQNEMDPAHPALRSEAGKIFRIACTQCHVLPDPQRHTAREWPAVVQRMKRHISWANTVVGPDHLRTTPVLETREIIRFLQRYARTEQKAN